MSTHVNSGSTPAKQAADPRARQWMLVLQESDPRAQAATAALPSFGCEVDWAWIIHHLDPDTSVHRHLALRFADAKRRSFVARQLGVPTSAVRQVRGRRGWEHYLRYLTHAEPDPELPSGEHLYEPGDVHANFDWQATVLKAKLPKTRAPKDKAIAQGILTGEITVEEVRSRYPGAWAKKGNAAWFSRMARDHDDQKALDREREKKRRERIEDTRDLLETVVAEDIIALLGETTKANEAFLKDRKRMKGFTRTPYPWFTKEDTKRFMKLVRERVTDDMRRAGWPVDDL